MTPEQIAARLSNKSKGQIFSYISRRICKVRKDVDACVIKETKAQSRIAEYSNCGAVKEGILSGERLPPEAPKGAKECFYVGDIKFFKMTSGKTCLAAIITGNRPEIQYFVNGKPSPEPEFLLASEKSKPESKEELAKSFLVPYKLINCDDIVEVI